MAAVQLRGAVLNLVIIVDLAFGNDCLGTVLGTYNFSRCLVVEEVSVHEDACACIGDCDRIIVLEPSADHVSLTSAVIAGFEEVRRKRRKVGIHVLRLDCCLLNLNGIENGIGLGLARIDGRLAGGLVVGCHGVEADRAFVPAATAGGVAHTDRDRVCAAVVEDRRVDIIDAVHVPRIGSVIDTDALCDVVAHAERSDAGSVDIDFVGFVKVADREEKSFFREVFNQLKCADIPRITAVIVLTAEGFVEIARPPAECRLDNAPGLIDIRGDVGDLVQLLNCGVIRSIGLVGLEIPVAHQVDELLVIGFTGILDADHGEACQILGHAEEGSRRGERRVDAGGHI